jgi:hypothetical protein
MLPERNNAGLEGCVYQCVCVCILRYTVRSIVQTKGDGELTELGHCRSESVFLHFGFSLHFSISSIVVLFIHLNNYIKIILNYEICSNCNICIS